MITYTELPNTITNRLQTVKASSYGVGKTIPDIPISVNQSYVLDNSESVIITNWYDQITTLGGWNNATGIWTVPKTGYYNTYIRVIMTAYDVNSNNEFEYGDFGNGSFIFCLIALPSGTPYPNRIASYLTFNTTGASGGSHVITTGNRTSVINCDMYKQRTYFLAGERYYLKVLNKTQLGYLETSYTNSVYQSLYLIIDELTS